MKGFKMLNKKLWFCRHQNSGALWAGEEGREEDFVAEEVCLYCGKSRGELRRCKNMQRVDWIVDYLKVRWDTPRQSEIVYMRCIEIYLFPTLVWKGAPCSALSKTSMSQVLQAWDEETRESSVPVRVERSRGTSISAQLLEFGYMAPCPWSENSRERWLLMSGSKWPWRRKHCSGLLQC